VLGALGDGAGAPAPSLVPVKVKGLSGVLQLSSQGSTSCALVSNGNVMCWGGDGDGELGNNEKTEGPHPTPAKVKQLTGARSISESGDTSCAVLTSGEVNCWGGGTDGQLGNGKFFSIPLPQHVKTLAGAVVVAAGGFSTCAVLTSGAVSCWGANSAGELGHGTVSKATALPVSVKGLP
jgi:alpha-tubulin suppressor-like RCC1 family protein